MSYFRPPKARKTGPWSITRLSNSTQKMSQKGGRVTVTHFLPASVSHFWGSVHCVTHVSGLDLGKNGGDGGTRTRDLCRDSKVV